jgi:hypothetical protein
VKDHSEIDSVSRLFTPIQVGAMKLEAEGLEYTHPKPSSHSGRIVGNPEVICPGSGLVMRSRLVGSDLCAWHRS